MKRQMIHLLGGVGGAATLIGRGDRPSWTTHCCGRTLEQLDADDLVVEKWTEADLYIDTPRCPERVNAQSEGYDGVQWDSMPTWRFTIRDKRLGGPAFTCDVSAPGPGLGNWAALGEAVSRYYVDRGAVQGKWVKIASSEVTKSGRGWSLHEVRTSRYDTLVVDVEAWTMRPVKDGGNGGKNGAAEEGAGGAARTDRAPEGAAGRGAAVLG